MDKKTSRVLTNLLIIPAMFIVLMGFPAPLGIRALSLRLAQEHQQSGSRSLQIVTLSARNDMISGGDVLVRIEVADRKSVV